MPCSSRCCSCNGGKKSSTASKSNCSGGRCPPRPTTSRSCAGGRCSTGQAKKSSNKGNSCSSRAGCYGSSCYEDSCCSSGRCYYKESSSNNVSITNSKILEDTTTHSMAKKSVHPDRITDSQQYNRTAKQRAKDANSINSFIEEDIIEPSTSNGKSISKKKKLPENKGRKCNSGLSSTVKQSAKNKKTDNMENQVKARKQTTKFENMKGNGNGHSVKIKKEIKSEPMSNSSDSDYLDQLLSEDESMDTVEEYVMNNLDKYGQYLNETFSSSDDEPPSKQLKLAGDLIRVKQEPDNNSTDDDYSTDDDFDAFSEDLSDDSSDYDSDEYEYDSCSWNESSEADYDDDDDSEYEDFQRDYYNGHHLDESDSDTDLDYIPEDDDDITIPKGSAITCDLTDENFTFESEKSQLIDYTCTDETENETSANISQLEMSVTPTETEKSEENDINEHFVVINAVISNTVLVVLKRKIFFNGCVSVKLVFGGAEIFGYEMKIGETLPVYSIYGHSSMYIRPTDRTVKDEHNLISSLKPFKEDFLNHDLLKLRRNCDPTKDTIILLEKTSNIALDTIDRFLGKSLIPPLSSFDKNSKWFQSEFCLQAKLHLEPSSPLRVDEDWDQIKLSAQSKILLVGGKGVGKSTMMRYLINSNINKFGKILLIDLDIGQPEMFLPQTISATVITGPLLHPGYLNATTMPTIAYMYGEINIVLQPIKYINCVMKLLLECASKAEFNNIPWIINTMGYNKGFGSEFIALFTRYISITDLIQINSTSANTSFPLDFTPEATNNFAFILLEKDANELLRNKEAKSFNYHKISAVRSTNEDSQGEKQLVAADLRTVRILAYLGRILKHKFDWFTDIQPISANLSDLTIVNSSACEEDLCETDLLQIINGNLVYLCESTTDHEMFKCHGLGIVRGIDWDQRKLFLLSSVSMSEMDKVNTIAISSIPLPATVILNQNPKVTGSILYAYNSLNSVGSKKVTQFSYRPSL